MDRRDFIYTASLMGAGSLLSTPQTWAANMPEKPALNYGYKKIKHE